MREERKKPRLAGRWKFLLLVITLYLLTGWLDPDLAKTALLGFVGMLRKVLPILAMVFVILLLINLLLKPEQIKDHLGQDAGPKAWFYAVIGGILISGPPFILYPMLAEFKKHGARNDLIAVFLYNRNVKIPFLPVMAYYFGLRYTVIVSLLIILFSLLNGFILGRLASDD